ncbi:hypothetical protein DOTSEDRAFT_93116, partial [Dothistroma septosporum NZE10]
SAILWRNPDQTVTLIDIPRSIEAAQGTKKYPCFDHVLSCEASQVAFPSDRPKTSTAKATSAINTVDQTLHIEYEFILQQALEDIKHHHKGEWCMQRPYVVQGTKRKRSESEVRLDSGRTESNHPKDLPQVVLGGVASVIVNVAPRDATEPTECTCVNDIDQDDFFRNCSERPTTLTIKHSTSEYTFRLPPGSAAFLGDCAQSRDFHRIVRSQASSHDVRRHFDFILMDPPWPNRSVRRTHKTAGATYQVSPSMNAMYDLISGMDLDMLMSDDCLVGIWITNKQAVRDLVLGEGGLLEQWGVVLEEEWLWLKITAQGEPMMPFDNVWRKPYEVLLVGRRHRAGGEYPLLTYMGVKRRILVGVPDLHSRKPCVKELIEPLLPKKPRVLEIFARNLVTGWWSWGNESIKFNWDGRWR